MIETLSLLLSAVEPAGADSHPWFDHPIVNTLLALGGGGLIVNWLKTRWQRQDRRRDKTLEFLESTGDRLNHLLSLIFNTLLMQNLSDERIDELRVLRRPVFEKRFAVRLGAEALLGSPAFSVRYDILANQLFKLIEVLPRKVGGAGEQELLKKIREEMAQLAEEWPAAPSDSGSHRHPLVEGDEVLAEMQRWAMMIWGRALELISGPLQRELG